MPRDQPPKGVFGDIEDFLEDLHVVHLRIALFPQALCMSPSIAKATKWLGALRDAPENVHHYI
jgi:hypothetical protein